MDVNTSLSHRRSLATRSGQIAYTELGAGPAALFVHGVGTSGVLWRHVIAELIGTSRCIAADLPAHGASPARNDMSVAALAEALADLCDSLGLGQADLIGNDTGGAIAQIFAARHPGSCGRSPLPTATARATSRRRTSRPSSNGRSRAHWRRSWSSSQRTRGRRTR
jgi:alpha-beta hydrolase superfamily lysophospholipase